MDDLINGRTPEEIKFALRCKGLEEECDKCGYKLVNCGLKCEIDALALIERLESERAAALAKVPKWISVEERLPEEDGEYLVLKVHNYHKDDGWMAQEVALFLRTRDPEWVIGNLCEVTHWMPLPEPAKEEEK